LKALPQLVATSSYDLSAVCYFVNFLDSFKRTLEMGLSELPNADSFYSPESIECETMLNLGSIYESNKEF